MSICRSLACFSFLVFSFQLSALFYLLISIVVFLPSISRLFLSYPSSFCGCRLCFHLWICVILCASFFYICSFSPNFSPFVTLCFQTGVCSLPQHFMTFIQTTACVGTHLKSLSASRQVQENVPLAD